MLHDPVQPEDICRCRLPAAFRPRRGRVRQRSAASARVALAPRKRRISLSVITISTLPPVDPQTPTPTYYQQLADEVIAAFEVIAGVLPKLEEAAVMEIKLARRYLNVPDALCVTTINAVEQLPELEAAKKLHAEQGRNGLQFLDAFRPVDDKLDSLSRRLKHALRVTKSNLGSAALQIYRITRAQASDGRSPGLASFAAAMKRDLARKPQTKAERDAAKAKQLQEAVDLELRRLGIDRKLLEKEVKEAA